MWRSTRGELGFSRLSFQLAVRSRRGISRMLSGRPSALALALLTGRSIAFIQPIFVPSGSLASRAHGVQSTNELGKIGKLCSQIGDDQDRRYHGSSTMSALLRDRHRTLGTASRCGRISARRLLRTRSSSSSNSSRFKDAGRAGYTRIRAVQSMPVRANMSLAGGAGDHEGGAPAGGYPPPEHLHGVFAVYKPKGFTSTDAVSKIKVSKAKA